jgi:hypothetical protein
MVRSHTIFRYLNLTLGSFASGNPTPLFSVSYLPSMPETCRGAAAEIEKSALSASEDNGSPPPVPVGRWSNRKAQAATPIALKSNKPSTSRATSEAGGKRNQTSKRNQASRDADAQPQPLIPVERSTEPSEKLHAADEADESAGAANPPANHAEREGRQPSLNRHDIDPDPFCFSR